jgi:hypothetical protein
MRLERELLGTLRVIRGVSLRKGVFWEVGRIRKRSASGLIGPSCHEITAGQLSPPAARRLGSVESGDAHVCACVIRGEPRDHVQCDAPRFCGIPSKWNIEHQLIVSEEDAALTSIGSRECDESLHLARGPNFEFHARSIGPPQRRPKPLGNIRERRPMAGSDFEAGA